MFNKKSMVIALVLSLSMMFLVVGCSSTEEEEVTLRIANYYATDHPVNQNLEETFKTMVEEETEGRVEVEIYPNNQLGSEQEFIEGVQMGSVEMAMTGNMWENTIPEFRIMQMPYMFVDYDHADEVLNGPIGAEVYEYLEDLDVKVLNSFPNGFRVISNNERAIESVEDAEGIDLRVFEGETIIDMMDRLGFDTTVMAMDEVFTSLQQGVIDGQDNPLATSYDAGWYEVQDHVAITNHMYSPGYIVINKGIWNGLAEEDQEVVQRAAELAGEQIRDDVMANDEEIIEEITEDGVEVTYPELEPFMEKVQPIIGEFIEEYPHTEDIINEIQEKAEDYL
ncbi:TRAP transporter substrate-binding protein [Natroniella sulfidigena]|uniref:TRAP transporter substrate-binding protein n=1 Tax=Natroniella sulfidigena TaxID=723921 RepID=UPI00200AD06D|nr:TRAP transporter substrate-binding protein [Natroniella sulfidigena]MCK8816719.1 TRAP transporter substrate-binding protein [Natroniella sulfidigena]